MTHDHYARLLRRGIAFGALIATSAPALAQNAPVINPSNVPLNDFCQVGIASFCGPTVIGTRTITVLSPTTTTAVAPGVSQVRGSSLVDFTGQLQVDGIQLQPNSLMPSRVLFSPFVQQPQVNVTTQYVANFDYRVGPGTGEAQGRIIANPGFDFVVNSLNVDSISIDLEDVFVELASGQRATFSLSSIDPTAIAANGTALTGRFKTRSDDDSGPLIFGMITGTARVVADPGVIVLNETGQSFLSPFALSIETTPVITTQLDENGLVTPTVSVTNGIDLNGSKVTELADGTAPGDAVNRRQLDVEAATRTAADMQLTSSLAAESTTRSAADAQLATSLAGEAAMRAQNDLQINQRIAAEEGSRATLAASLTSETNARVAADLAMSSQLGSLGGRIDQLTARIDQMDDRVSSGTATAIALGGNAFLPDMKFNLTANVGTYDGAHAGALQLGALVSPHVAVNAGVATGFNRNGKTAGRVGMTFGW